MHSALLLFASWFVFFVDYISYLNIFRKFNGSNGIEMGANIENVCISDDEEEVVSVEEEEIALSTKGRRILLQ